MEKVIEKNNKLCYGCTACKNICPKNAITMKEDEEGFLYPYIDEKLCINCNLCRKVCPALLERLEKTSIQTAYVVRLKDDKERMKSRSGGAFVAISDEILKRDGTIYGAALKKDLSVHHVKAENHEQRNQCRGSKYVQSDLRDTFKQVYEDLKQDKEVLYTGTSCQIDGLNSYLKNKNISTNKLYTCDVICHGVPSPKLYREYIEFLNKKYKKDITNFNFRDKSLGWRACIETITLKNNKTVHLEYFRNLFWTDKILRPRCYECAYANLNRVSDITIGDCWGIENVSADWNDEKGVSLVIINTPKGEELFEKSNKNTEYMKINIEKCLQPNLVHPTEEPENRESFWKDYKEEGFKYILKKYGKYDFKSRLISFLRAIKSKMSKRIKRYLKKLK